jgi:anti-sigma B factor antagonist
VIEIAVSGDLDLSTASVLCARVEETFRQPAPRVLLDLSRLSFCDSTGLRALLGVVQEARVHGVALRIVVPASSAPTRAFELAGALEFLPWVERRDAGLNALSA